MFDFAKTFVDLKALYAAYQGHSFGSGEILIAAGPVVTDAGEAVKYFLQTQMPIAAMKADPDCAQCVACCNDILAHVQASTPVAATAAAVGEWGDGTFFRIFMEVIIKKLLELFGG